MKTQVTFDIAKNSILNYILGMCESAAKKGIETLIFDAERNGEFETNNGVLVDVRTVAVRDEKFRDETCFDVPTTGTREWWINGGYNTYVRSLYKVQNKFGTKGEFKITIQN